MDQIQRARRSAERRTRVEQQVERAHCFGFKGCRLFDSVCSPFRNSLQDERVRSLQPEQVVARILLLQLARQLQSFRKTLFAFVEAKQQYLGLVAFPVRLFRYAFERLNTALLRATRTDHAGYQLRSQRQRAYDVIVQTNGKFGIVKVRIEFDYL